MNPNFNDPRYLSSWAQDYSFYRAPAPDSVEPMPYQYAGVEYGITRDHRIYGDAPGLGKTAECILTSNAMEAGHTLVVCPASLRLNWEREIWRWSTIPNVSTYPVLKAKDGVSLHANYCIISYDLLRNESIQEALMDHHWDHLILDEAHALKDPRGNKRTKVICAPDMLPRVVGSISMASGTIMPNQPIECYNAMRLLNWDSIDRMSLEDFREHYYAKGGGFVRKTVNGQSKVVWDKAVRNQPQNLDELQYRLRRNLMVRRLKEDVLTQLPPKQWHPFPLPLDADMRRALAHPGWAKAEKLYEMDPDAFDSSIPIDGEISTARRLLGEAKAPAVASYIEDLLQSGISKLVVTAWHRTVLDYLRKRLSKYGLVYMDGSTSSTGKQRAVDQFQQNDDVAIILGQMLTMGEGHTLVAAQDAVFAEFWYVPGKNDQLLDRIHRMGQKGGYIIGHVPVVPGSLDERVISSAVTKDRHIYDAQDRRW